MYCLELASMKWTIIEGKNYCEGRNSHACALFKNQIYFFGGSQHHSNPTNDFFKFSPAQATWTLIQGDDGVPPERDLAVMNNVNDQYLFLLGGVDILEDKIFDDAFIFHNGRWGRLNVSEAPSERVRMAVAVCGRRIFGFGGEGPGEQVQLFDNLYELTINQFDLQLTYREIQPHGSRPQRRTGHAMVSISERFLLVYGGEGRGEGSQEGEVLGDIWVYDLEQMAWSEIQTLYGSMTPRYEFTMTVYSNELLIFGGMNEEHMVLDELAKLEFMEERSQPAEWCALCEEDALRRSTRSPPPLEPSISAGFYYNLAQEITSPFRAVQIITEVAEKLAAPSIHINSAKTTQDFDYLTFQWTAGFSISTTAFLDMTHSNQNAEEARLLHLMKVGGFRLGKTFLYVEVSAEERRVLLMSADNRFAPNYEDSPMHFSYVECLRTGDRFHGGSFGDKQTVANILKSQVGDPFPLLSRTSGNLLAVFQLNILPTVEKAYYYELIFHGTPESDLRIYHNQKKVELLESMAYQPNSLPDFSCKAYLRYSKLQSHIAIFLSQDEQPVPTDNYLDYLRSQQEAGYVREIAVWGKGGGPIEKCVIFECLPTHYLENNQGVLIYCGNQLIDRYDCPFGHLLSDKFYKKKYRQRKNLFRYAGVLCLSDSLTLNLACTKPTNRVKYQQVMEEIITTIKSSRLPSKEPDPDMNCLYNRFSTSRDPSKRMKRDINNGT